MAKFVRIQSTRPITVTGGLQAINMTDEHSLNPDKLNVKPSWTSFRVQLKQGTGYYPARIKDWSSVKVLSSQEILTVGATTDVLPDNLKPEDKAAAEKMYKELEYEYSKYEKQQKTLDVKKKTEKKVQKQAQENLIDLTEED